MEMVAPIEEAREKRRAALLSVASATLLVSLKAFLVVKTGSLGVLSEALHSGLDLVAAIITFLSVRVSDRPADETHPYGHGKFENFSAFVETGLLALTALYIIYEAFDRLFFVRDPGQDVRNRVQPRRLLVVGRDDHPRRDLRVGLLEHPIAGPRVVVPLRARRQVHRAQLPLPLRVADPRLEPALLLVVGHLEPQLDEHRAPFDDVALHLGAELQEAFVLVVGAEPHDVLDAGAVVPAAIEDDDFASGGEVLEVPLHVDLALLAV